MLIGDVSEADRQGLWKQVPHKFKNKSLNKLNSTNGKIKKDGICVDTFYHCAEVQKCLVGK